MLEEDTETKESEKVEARWMGSSRGPTILRAFIYLLLKGSFAIPAGHKQNVRGSAS